MQATLSPANVNTAELTVIDRIGRKLPDGDLKNALEEIATTIRLGDKVFVAGRDASLSSNEVAMLLGVSRPHLYKILDSGALPFVRVGNSQRRVLIADVAAYRERTRMLRAKTAALLAGGDLDALLIDEMD
jgi:excisionase family DNA binding protein